MNANLSYIISDNDSQLQWVDGIFLEKSLKIKAFPIPLSVAIKLEHMFPDNQLTFGYEKMGCIGREIPEIFEEDLDEEENAEYIRSRDELYDALHNFEKLAGSKRIFT